MPKLHHLWERILVVALLFLHIVPPAGAAASETEDDSPRYRALLIACDEFVDMPNMDTIGENNLRIMETMLEEDVRGFEVKRQYNITSSKEALAYAIKWAFADATEDDVSLLYISTHGAFNTGHNNPEGELYLSDGSLQDVITAQELNAAFDTVPGTKVLLVDACNSGALIGKGVSPDVSSARVARTFQSSDYKALTSSGASENSWYLQPTLHNAPPGSSYFTTAMAVGAGLIGGYAADLNRDGTITLKEMYDYLWVNQASSAVQMFPQDDSYPLLVYEKARLNEELRGELTGFVFGSTSLDQDNPVLDFGYTVSDDTRVAYRITYLRDGAWDWEHGQTIRDVTEFDGDMDPLGDVSPGRKQIQLALDEVLPDDWTYGMIHVMTLGDSEEGKRPFIYASRVFNAKPTQDDPGLSVHTTAKWVQKYKPELEVFIEHAGPVNLSVSIHDEEGNLIRRLMTSRVTRPQALQPDGSLLYWNGRDKDDVPVEPGKYSVKAIVKAGEKEYTAEASFTLE